MIVLDCSAATGMVRGTPDGKGLICFIQPGEKIIAPHLLQYELANTFWKYVRAGHMSKEQAREYLSAALGYVTEFKDAQELIPEVLSESVRLNHPAYDLFYFVLARRNGACLYTLDNKLIKLCEENRVDCIHPVEF